MRAMGCAKVLPEMRKGLAERKTVSMTPEALMVSLSENHAQRIVTEAA